jgi:hypothetical protein
MVRPRESMSFVSFKRKPLKERGDNTQCREMKVISTVKQIINYQMRRTTCDSKMFFGF